MKQTLLFLFPIILFLFACEDSESIVDVNGNQLNEYGELHRDTLTAINSTFLEGGKVSTGFSQRLSLGSYNDFESRFLVKFTTIPPDSIIIDSLFFLIQSVSHYGEAMQDFQGQIKLVTTSWDENINTDGNWSYQNDVSDEPSTTAHFTITAEDSFFYTITLPDTLISIWHDTTNGDQNHGLMIDFENAAYIKEFSSENSSIVPKIIYVYQNAANDSTIRDTVLAAFDASIIQFNGNLQSDSLLFVSSGYTHRAFVEFDLDSIPENIIISNVNFVILKDSLGSEINANQSSNFYFRMVTTPFEDLLKNPPSFEVDSTFNINLFHNVSLLEKGGDHLEINEIRRGETGQYFIQSIINETINYGAFMLHYVGEGNTISIYALKGASGNIKKSNRPKMIIEYFSIPDSRL